MEVNAKQYYGGFYDTHLDITLSIDEQELLKSVVWVKNDNTNYYRAFVNLNFPETKEESKRLKDICLELRLDYIERKRG